jgi:hypothetical protein
MQKNLHLTAWPIRRRLAFAASFEMHRFTMHLQGEATGAVAMIRANRKML